jgi:phage gpG-like protein
VARKIKRVLGVDINRKAFPRVRSCMDAFNITVEDMQGPILTRLAQTHRKQERRIFASEGAEGAQGRWPPLSPKYKAYKRRVKPGRKILVFSGDMKERFIKPSRAENIERFTPEESKGNNAVVGLFEFGAESDIASFHFQGGTTTRPSKPGRGKNKMKGKRKKPFKSVVFTTRLPKRDMVTKTTEMLVALRETLISWYRDERIPQVLKFCAAEAAKANRK